MELSTTSKSKHCQGFCPKTPILAPFVSLILLSDIDLGCARRLTGTVELIDKMLNSYNLPSQ